MKVVLSLEHDAIPPIYDLQALNPNIDFDGANVEVVRDLIEWPKDEIRRASINSFGYGGANGHCIIDHVHTLFPGYVKPGVYKKSSVSGVNGVNGKARTNGTNGTTTNGNGNGHSKHHHYPITKPVEMKRSARVNTRQWVLLPFSAHNKDSLKSNIEALGSAIDEISLADVAYTLGTKRSRLPQRTFRVVNKDSPAEGLAAEGVKVQKSPLQPSSVAFVFTGQGAQWPAIGAELFEYRVFRTTISYLDDVLNSLPTPPSWTLTDILSGNSDPGLIQTAEVSQAACTALQVGLVDLLASWSVRPVAVAGHSSGEIGAAYASGYITAAQAIVSAYLRGKAVAKNRQDGLMLAVGLSPEETLPYLDGKEDKVRIAAYNSPGSVTLSGDAKAVQELSDELNKASVFNRALKTGGNAYHSHHMLPLGRDYDFLLSEGLTHIRKLYGEEHYQKVLWISSVTPNKNVSNMDMSGPSYWRANLESPVRFSEAVEKLASLNEVQVIVEIGPHPALKSPIDQILKKIGKTAAVSYGSTMKRQVDGSQAMLELAGNLFSLNATVDLGAVNAVDSADGGLAHGSIAVDLPAYKYTYGPVLYHESRLSKEYRYREVTRHDLLGSKVVGTAKLRPQWRNILRTRDVPWLSDHRLLPDAVFPAAGYVALAVEAASRIYNELPQPTPPITGYSLRNVAIKSSLQIPEDDYGVEIISSMEFTDIDAGRSAWATFSVSSVARESQDWTEHCTGSIKVEFSERLSASSSDSGLNMSSSTGKAADVNAWYKKFTAIGLGYGATFQPLSEIRADTQIENQVSAQVALKTTEGTIKGGESAYLLHPASLDGAIQLGLIACHKGQPDEASTAFVPVQISQLYLSAGVPKDLASAIAVARGERRGLRGAYLDLNMKTLDGRELLQVDGLRCTSYSHASQSLQKVYSSPFTRLVWKPDIRALNNNQCRELFPPTSENSKVAPLMAVVEKLAYSIVCNIYETFAGPNATEPEPTPTGEVGHFFDWVKRRGANDDNEIRREFKSLSPQERQAKIEELAAQAPDIMEIQTLKLFNDNIGDVLSENRTAIDLYISKGLLTPLYERGLLMTGAHPQFFRIIDCLGHANPNLRFFEIGGGTGGATRVALRALRGPNGIKNFKDYTFTDITPGFLTTAQESLADVGHDGMIYNVLNIEQDPETLGYERVYDVVVACQVLHVSSNIKRTLSHVAKLLKPGGKLILEETTSELIVPIVVVGTFTGFWSGIPDGRLDGPFMNLETWDKNLRAAGFSGTELVLDDFPAPYTATSTIVSTYLGPPTPTKGDAIPSQIDNIAPVHLLCNGSEKTPPPLLSRLGRALEDRGITTESIPLERVSSIAQGSHVVVFLDNKHLQLNSGDLAAFQYLARNAASMIVLTSTGFVKGRNPDGALVAGLLRVLKTENPAGQFVSIDINGDNFMVSSGNDDEMGNLTQFITDQVLKLLESDTADAEERANDDSPSDREFVWQDGASWVSRFVAVSEAELPVPNEYHVSDSRSPGLTETQPLPISSHGAIRAAFETPGVIGSLYFAPNKDHLTPLPHSFIDVNVTAVGLDHADLDTWSGRVDTTRSLSEFVGTVAAVGADVGGAFKIGDIVCGLSTGRFRIGNSARVPAALALKVQQRTDASQIFTVLKAYATVCYALEYVARLPPVESTWSGKTLLVQSATTPVGLAAISVAKAKGADVFAIVNTPEDASLLARGTGISLEHVFSLPDRVANLRRAVSATKNKGGFDIILSTTQDDLELLYATPSFIKAPGHLIHVGRVESRGSTDGPDMGLLAERNAIFSVVDLAALLESTPALGSQLLQGVEGYYRRGLLKPARPFGGAPTDVAALPSVLADFSKFESSVTDKLIISFAQPDSEVKMVKSVPIVQFDAEAAYVVTGALGGLGQSIIRWMVDRGARNLVLLSRRSINSVPDAKALVDKLTSRGVNISPAICDVADITQVRSVIDKASRPIRGVVHAAVSWHDLSFDKLTPERWQDSLAAKVQGTKNLHDATIGLPLDFFVMTTTLVSVYALATQAAYTAANNFQDAFARHRRALGLPASTMSFSLIRDVGDTGSNQSTVATFERNKTLTLNERQFLALFEPAFFPNESKSSLAARTSIDPLCTANLVTCLDPAAMLAKLQNSEGGTGSTPRWYSDARVSTIMRAFADAQQYALDQSAQDSGAAGGKSSSARIQQELEAGIRSGPSERASTVGFVERTIAETVASMLFIDPEGVSPAKSVADYGVDSLIAAELRNWFVDVLKTDISMLKLLDQSTTMSALAGKIVDDALAQASSLKA